MRQNLILKYDEHYGSNGFQAGLISVHRREEEEYHFQVQFMPFCITPDTGLSAVPTECLVELDHQMWMEGECDADDPRRDAKFSKTRKHIQAEIEKRS